MRFSPFVLDPGSARTTGSRPGRAGVIRDLNRIGSAAIVGRALQ